MSIDVCGDVLSAAVLVTTAAPSFSYASSISKSSTEVKQNTNYQTQNIISTQEALEIEQALIQSQINPNDLINQLISSGVLPAKSTLPTLPVVSGPGSGDMITPYSKGSVSVKAISNAIQKHEKSIDKGIKGVINSLPLPGSTKTKLISLLSVGGLLKAIGHYTGIVDSVEDFLTDVIMDITGLGKSTSNIIAKTITFFLPI